MFAMHRKIEELRQESMRFFLLFFFKEKLHYVGVHLRPRTLCSL